MERRTPTTTNKTRDSKPEWLNVLLSITGLVTFVVAQNVYEVLSRNQDFLTVRQVSNLQLLEIVLAFNVLPVALLFLLWATFQSVHHLLARGFLILTYFLLFLIFFLQIHNLYLSKWQPFRHAFVIWILPAASIALAGHWFSKPFRSFLTVLSVLAPVFPILFLARNWRQPLTIQSNVAPQVSTKISAAQKPVPPLFIMLFDELSLKILLDADGRIDAGRFPNFSKLAIDGDWFRNATANADQTIDSVPVILTGNFHHGTDPSASAYPQNLFTLLRPSYDNIYIYEMETHFCSKQLYHCPGEELSADSFQLLKDTFYLFCTRVAPKSLGLPIPDMRRTWGPFRNYSEEAEARIKRFDDFLQALDDPGSVTNAYYFHNMISHSPYNLTSDGKTYQATSWHFDKIYAGSAPALDDLIRRYRMQARFADHQLGAFVQRLKDLGIYDKSLIVILADHGVSWTLDSPGRTFQKDNAEMMMSVPLIFKPPFSKDGKVSDQDVQLIDIVPTIADLLGIDIPWKCSGRSIFSSTQPTRMKDVYDAWNHHFVFPTDFGLKPVEMFYPVPQSPWVGQSITSFTIDSTQNVAGWVDTISERDVKVKSADDEFPITVSGWTLLPDEKRVPEKVVIALNGTIVAETDTRIQRSDVAKVFKDPLYTNCGWAAQFSTQILHPGDNSVEAYAIVNADKRTLGHIKRPSKNVIHRAE